MPTAKTPEQAALLAEMLADIANESESTLRLRRAREDAALKFATRSVRETRFRR